MDVQEQTNDLDHFTSQLSARIWGHRFRDSQRGPEYVLEFLNVLFGADYSFSSDSYIRRKSEGLRKFIFEGVKAGGGGDTLVLDEEEKMRLSQAVPEADRYALKQFLRNQEVILYNLTGKEADRSWYAKSLYPLHQSLLYVEMRKKGKKLQSERNFYARGGELYFLMLSHGTDGEPQRRAFIESRIANLLTRNKAIEKVVEKITGAFEIREKEERGQLYAKKTGTGKNAPDEVPMLPSSAYEENKQLFTQFAYELERLLLVDIEILDMFHLLTSLVCFQLARYMHERSLQEDSDHLYFCDCLEGGNKPLFQQSARIFDEHENLIKSRFEREFEQNFRHAVGQPEQIAEQLPAWKLDPDAFIDKLGLKSMVKRKEAIKRVLAKCVTTDDVLTKLYSEVREAVSEQMKKHQLNVTRTLSRDGGFATFRRGSGANYRYTISDSFLQMLVFTKVRPKEKMEYHEFLETLYQDYHIVIGEQQAKSSGLYTRSKLNVRYFQENEKALRSKLKLNGLLVEFSDATAMIHNPYASAMEGSYV
ncbi:hypothetical protein [Paenibacillus thalictri]|uniref:Uncharacterized protein n=1 Tax=Paenibacillus thalictri TaxID=2527873 RepID=A0A4V2J4R4_9BACL|nr:hypothetical protein [Paenibacillus thalictri]TBL80852.1 hypothetical protein EYB31_06445 [Paenibacillus thalictri]